MERPAKTFRLVYKEAKPELSAYLRLLGDPAEVRLGATDKTFISIRGEGISLSPGLGNNINFQGMSQNMRYAGMLMDLPFPMSIMPTTPFTPFPKQIFAPPLGKLVPLLVDMSAIASTLIGL